MLQTAPDTSPSPERIDFDAATRSFEQEGFVVFRGVVDKAVLTRHSNELFEAFDAANAEKPLFEGGGGMIMGHLNCFPGEQSRLVYEALEKSGVVDFVRKLWPKSVRAPNVGCNFNLTRSSPQNYHADGYAADAFPIINVASVDTDNVNGALDVLERTHLREYQYWEIVRERPRSIRLPLKQGDVLVRSSMLWHRGMPNRSSRARPMLAFTWEDGGSPLPDPFQKNGGKIAFYPNRYTADTAGKFREYAYVLAPGAGAVARFAMSLLKR